MYRHRLAVIKGANILTYPPHSAKSGRQRLSFHVRSGTIRFMRNGLFFMQALAKILVGEIFKRLSEPLEYKALCVTTVLGYAASCRGGSVQLLFALRYA